MVVVTAVALAGCTDGTTPSDRDQTPAAEGSSAPISTPASKGTDEPRVDTVSCINDDISFTVDYPALWWANEEIVPADPTFTPIPACTYFAPQPVEIAPNAGLPPGIAIWFDSETQFEITGEVRSQEETTVDGRRALVVETEASGQSGFEPEGTRTYRYVIDMGDGSEVLVATSTQYVDDAAYEEAKPILDAMMETLDFDED